MKIPRGITPMFEFIHPLIPKFPLEQTIKTRNRRLDKDVDLLLKHIKDDKKKENEQIPSQDIQNNKGFNNGDRKSNTISELQIQKRKKRIKTATNRTILEMIVKDSKVRNYITQATRSPNYLNTISISNPKNSSKRNKKSYPSLFLTTVTHETTKTPMRTVSSIHKKIKTENLYYTTNDDTNNSNINTIVNKEFDMFKQKNYSQFRRNIKSSITPKKSTYYSKLSYTIPNKTFNSIKNMGRTIIKHSNNLVKDIDMKREGKSKKFESKRELEVIEKNNIENLIDYHQDKNEFFKEIMNLCYFNRKNEVLSKLNEKVILKNPKYFKDNFTKNKENDQIL